MKAMNVTEPGNYAFDIGNAANKLMSDTNYWTDDSRYKKERDGMVAGLTQVEKGPDPIEVAMAALDIMQSVTPKNRYMVTETVGQADATVRRQISKMLELNNGQVHQFDRAKLIEMLDEEIDKDPKNKAAAK
ncbi:MAG: 3-hydroxybutyrate dehydrogenase [Paraglaciecola sp.]|jgi:hypothetical protein